MPLYNDPDDFGYLEDFKIKGVVSEKEVAAKKDPKIIKVYDEFNKIEIECRTDHIDVVVFKAIKRYDFENNVILEEGYTSNNSTITSVYDKNDKILKFVTFEAAMAHPELKYRSSTNALYHNSLNKRLKKLNWSSDYPHNAIKERLSEEDVKGLTKEQHELAYRRGQITTSYNVTHGLKYTFGVELETNGGYVPEFIQTHLNCKTVRDGSVKGAEVVTGILAGDSGFYQLNQQCYHYSKACPIDHTCGTHVHIGNIRFNKTFSVAMYKLGLLVQDEIFDLFPYSRQKTRNAYYINKGMHNGCCYKIPMLEGFKNPLNIDEKCVGDTMKQVEYMYHNQFIWLSGGNTPDSKRNKLQKHPNQYPDARYVWLNSICHNFNRTKKNLANTQVSKEKQKNLKYLNETSTVEFRNHSATLSYRKISNWIKICMALVNYAENNSYKILASKAISLEEIMIFTYGEHARPLLEYIEERKAMYKGLGEAESITVEDREYATDVKETKLFKNKLDVLCV
jgi:hypothetical protein